MAGLVKSKLVIQPGWEYLAAVGGVEHSPGGRCHGRRGEGPPVMATLIVARS